MKFSWCDNSKTIYKLKAGPFCCHAAMFSYGVELTLEQEELLADLIATWKK